MLPFKRILFPVDYSEQAAGAARYVEALAGRFDSDVVMFHVADFPHYNDTPGDLSPARKREQLETFLAQEFQYIRVERLVDHGADRGDPARAILRIAAEKHCDLIMMPTHGLGGFRRFLLGSVAAKILHDADCPVWTGAHLEQAPPLEKIEFRRFVCAVSAEPYSAKVLDAARELATEYSAALTMVHVENGNARSKAAVEETARKAGVAEVVFERGDIPHAVATEAARRSADLLIIGRDPSPGIFGRLRGHAYPIIRQSPCPVLSV